VVPCWLSSYFWPVIINDFGSYIEDILKVKGNKVLIHGLNKNSLLGSNEFNGYVLALKLDCSKSE
jgi:ABC-type multidrug transport system permease subunit